MLKQPVRSLLAKQMRAKTAEKVREEHYPAPFRLIDLFEQFGDDKRRSFVFADVVHRQDVGMI